VPKRTPEEIFEHYAIKLAHLAARSPKRLHVRYIVIQYVCSYPKLDADAMAVCLLNAGFVIDYDDSTISREKNLAIRDRVMDKFRKEAYSTPSGYRSPLEMTLSDIAKKDKRMEQ